MVCEWSDKMQNIYGVDFGVGNACAIYGPDGAVSKRNLSLPRVKGGRTPAMEFPMIVEAIMTGNSTVSAGDVVVESATIGASGCEPDDIVALLGRVPERSLFTVSCRAVKNYRKDHGLAWAKGARYAKDGEIPPVTIDLDTQVNVHVEDAEIIWRIATEAPCRLKRWLSPSTGPTRQFTSVRPMDKRNYRDERALTFLDLVPPYETLPPELRDVLGNGKEYSRSMVMPFAMASTEAFIDDGSREHRRRRYEKVIGLYDHGRPSFYRRATITWMHEVAKVLADSTRIEEVTVQHRKAAWKATQRQIRWFFHLTMAHQGR